MLLGRAFVGGSVGEEVDQDDQGDASRNSNAWAASSEGSLEQAIRAERLELKLPGG